MFALWDPRRSTAAALAYFFFTLCAFANEAHVDGQMAPGVQNLGLDKFIMATAGELQVATFNYSKPDARYLRLKLGGLYLPDGVEMVVEGRRVNGVEKQAFTLQGPLTAESYDFPLIANDELTIRVAGKDLAKAHLRISELYYQKDPAQPLLSIYGDNDIVDISKIESNLELSSIARSIVFLSFTSNGKAKVCSGFLITQNRIMTNEHCVSDAAECATTDVIFDYLAHDRRISFGYQTKCSSVVHSEPKLDYSVIELTEAAPAEFKPLPFTTFDPVLDQPAVLIQHPGGYPKKIAQIGCSILDFGVPSVDPPNRTDITDRCDTIEGSSGSPIIFPITSPNASVEYCVGALHHWGFEDRTDYSNKNRAIRSTLLMISLQDSGIPFLHCK